MVSTTNNISSTVPVWVRPVQSKVQLLLPDGPNLDLLESEGELTVSVFATTCMYTAVVLFWSE